MGNVGPATRQPGVKRMAQLESLGKYEIRRELGRGAMGVVYEGYDPMIKRVVALKTIRADQLAGEDAETVIARFRREAQAAGRLNHPNIVAIYDFGEDQGVWYIAMEYVKGRELKDYFQANERFAPTDIVRIMTQILATLGYSHKLGVIHRDIKPANIFLLDDGTVKVADFGIAHIESSTMTQVGSVLGTPSYMSPEQILGLPIDGRSDLFSAGVILYQFLTGERPFTGSSTVTMHKVLEEDPLPPSRFNVQVPGAMDAVVRKALAKRPDDRYQSAEEFADALRAAAQREASTADPTLIASTDPTVIRAPNAKSAVDAPAAATTAGGGVAAQPSAAPPPPAPAKKSKSTAIAIVAGLAAIAVAAGLWTMLKSAAPADTPKAADAGKVAQAPAPNPAAAPGSAPAAASGSPPAAASLPKTEAGTMVISASGFVDPNDPRYAKDKSQLAADLRADSKGQLVAKALGLMIDTSSLATNYDVLRDRLMAKSGAYVTTVVEESAPRLGKDGLMSMTTQAVVNVKALQKSLNQMSRDERIQFIRAGGDPKVSVRIVVTDADQPGAPPQPSQLAENLLKERIKAFGFRTWSEDSPDGTQPGADFLVQGEAQLKRLSMRLPASGVVVTKYALNSWTVKCIDRATGEEIYFNTTLPKGLGSWASDGEALNAIGAKIADEFSRDFFLQHVYVTGRRVSLTVDGMPAPTQEDLLWRELISLPAVITATPRSVPGARAYDLALAGSGAAGDLVTAGVLKPLNAKLGQSCFALGPIAGDAVTVVFDKRCSEAPIISRLETNPPAGFYVEPPGRQKAVIRDPDMLRKLSI
jgi:serine/threonine-protein kinase